MSLFLGTVRKSTLHLTKRECVFLVTFKAVRQSHSILEQLTKVTFLFSYQRIMQHIQKTTRFYHNNQTSSDSYVQRMLLSFRFSITSPNSRFSYNIAHMIYSNYSMRNFQRFCQVI